MCDRERGREKYLDYMPNIIPDTVSTNLLAYTAVDDFMGEKNYTNPLLLVQF